MFRDTIKARWLQPDGTYVRRPAPPGETPCRVQQALQEDIARAARLARERVGVEFRPERG
jgi:hypothetical protein